VPSQHAHKMLGIVEKVVENNIAEQAKRQLLPTEEKLGMTPMKTLEVKTNAKIRKTPQMKKLAITKNSTKELNELVFENVPSPVSSFY